MSHHKRRNRNAEWWSNLVFVALVLTLSSCALPPLENQLVLTAPTSQSGDEISDGMPYLLYVPNPHYHTTPIEGWPLILFLHGAFESGEDINRVARHGIPARIEAGDDFPFVVVSPQSPRVWRKWSATDLAALLDHVEKYYPINEDRVYVTGISKGGAGTWSMALAYPNRFAAIAPACAFGDPAHVHQIAHVPVWAYHGARDFLVPPRKGERLVDAHRAAGGQARWTLQPEAGHSDCGDFYDRSDLYAWFLAHRRAAHLPGVEVDPKKNIGVSCQLPDYGQFQKTCRHPLHNVRKQ
jgi:poly(3-hydroxybutyrate) depolymerase